MHWDCNQWIYQRCNCIIERFGPWVWTKTCINVAMKGFIKGSILVALVNDLDWRRGGVKEVYPPKFIQAQFWSVLGRFLIIRSMYFLLNQLPFIWLFWIQINWIIIPQVPNLDVWVFLCEFQMMHLNLHWELSSCCFFWGGTSFINDVNICVQ